MIVLVTDPVTNNIVKNLKTHPYVIHGSGHNITKIYFETENSKNEYLKNRNLKGVLGQTRLRNKINKICQPAP